MLRILLIFAIFRARVTAFRCDDAQSFIQNNENAISMEDLDLLVTGQESKIGSGSNGSVSKISWNQELTIAVKKTVIYNRELQETEGEYLQTLSMSESEFFPKFYGCFVSRNNLYFAMELLEGSLKTNYQSAEESEIHTIYNEFWKLPAELRIDAYAQIAKAISLMHSIGYVHHDIKPENIGVKSLIERPQLKLIDFGLTEPIGTILTMGTPLYSTRVKLLYSPYYSFRKDRVSRDSEINNDFADVLAFIVSIYEIENARSLTSVVEDLFPEDYNYDFQKSIDNRGQKIADTEWMNNRGLDICTSDSEDQICFEHIIRSVMEYDKGEMTIGHDKLKSEVSSESIAAKFQRLSESLEAKRQNFPTKGLNSNLDLFSSTETRPAGTGQTPISKTII